MKPDRDLMQYSLYASATGLLIYLGIVIINHLGSTLYFVVRLLGDLADLISPLLIALSIAYLLKPAVSGIENLLTRHNVFKQAGNRRIVGILLTYSSAIAVFVALIFGIYIMVGGKLSNNTSIAAMLEYMTSYLQNKTLTVNAITTKLDSLNIPLPINLNEKIAQIVSYVQEYFAAILGGTTNFMISLGGNIVSFFVGIVLSVYLIKDSEYFIGLWNKIFLLVFGKSSAGVKVVEILGIVDDTFKNYIRGQLLEATIVAVLSVIVLQFIGIDYALMIGIIAGICNMIPYVGPFAGTVLAVIMALLSGQPMAALWAIVGMLAVQQIDNNLVAPKIVGDSVGLHPVFTMMAIIIGGNVGGLIGMLIAVPVVASAKILLSRWYWTHVKKNSSQ